jgi:Protein of unknown function (DUF1549)/Protein of unknown function (DUF1553)
MSRWRLASVLLALAGLFVLPLLLPAARGQEPATAQKGTVSAMALSDRVDRYISARWRKDGVRPTAAADDATFYRRVHLDLVGKIPSILEIRDFLSDDRPDKRRIWIDKLLDSEDFADHFANVYRQMMLPTVENQEATFALGAFESWLRKKFKENVPYDKMVRELLTVTVQPGAGFRGPEDMNNASPIAFYAANEYKAENLAGAAARLFLGVKIECAQCHKHPTADWTQNQFWEFAVFFTRVNPNAQQIEVDDNGNQVVKPQPKQSTEPQITIPKTETVVKAKFLDGKAPIWTTGSDPRKVLAEWITSPRNEYFARITVNQMWHYFFGSGLVDPFDDFGDHNPASHPELLDELSEQFVKSGYDLKYLARAIVSSKAYQLSSTPTLKKKDDDEPENMRLFARMPLRQLTGEQLFDSLAEVMEYKVDRTRQAFALGLTPREEFLAKFNNPENKRVDTHTSILQALHLMNGKFMANATSLEKNKTLATVAASSASIPAKIETLYLVTLARPPRPEELERMVSHVNNGPMEEQAQRLGDIMWVLLNSAEFSLNH